jgi:hypothetical protein
MVAKDVSGGHGRPATKSFPIAPSDTNELEFVTEAIYVGGEGDLSVLTLEYYVATYAAVPAGQIIPVRARKVFATGTTATNLVGML